MVNSLQLNIVHKDFLEISIPDGQYAEDFGLLNNCIEFNGHVLMQQINPVGEIRPLNPSWESRPLDDRRLCPDGSCTGVIEKGRCTDCGRRA